MDGPLSTTPSRLTRALAAAAGLFGAATLVLAPLVGLTTGASGLTGEAGSRSVLTIVFALAAVGAVLLLSAVAMAVRRDAARAESSAGRHRFIIQTTLEGYWEVGADGRTVAVNRALCRTLGLPAEDIIGRRPEEFATDAGRQALAMRLNDPTEPGGRRRDDIDLVSLDGTVRHTRFAITMLSDRSGGDGGWFAIVADFTERRQAEDELRRRELRHRAIIDAAAEGYWELDHHRRTVRVNAALCRMLGYAETDLLGKRPVDFVDETNKRVLASQDGIIDSTAHRTYEVTLRQHDGSQLPTIFNATTLRDSAGTVTGSFALVTDVSGLKAAQHALHKAMAQVEGQVRFLQAVIDAVPSPLFVIDADGRWLVVNEATGCLLGRTRAEVVGRHVTDLAVGDPPEPPRWAAGAPNLADGASDQVEEAVTAANGNRYWLLTRRTGTTVPSHGPITVGVVADVTALKEMEATLRRLATTDSLTGVSNRRHFMDQAAAEYRRACRFHRPLSAMMIDIDHFKQVNDTHGHPMGDAVIRNLAQVAQSVLRNADIFGRIGGEEFAVILPETDAPGLQDAAERLRRAMETVVVPINRNDLGQPDGESRPGGKDGVRFTVSIGAAVVGPYDGDIESLLQRADHALYAAKRAGRNRVVVVE